MTDRHRRSMLWLILGLLVAGQFALPSGPSAGALFAQNSPGAGDSGKSAPARDPNAIPPSALPNNAVTPRMPGKVQSTGGDNVVIIPISGVIYDFTLDSLERRVDKAMRGGATLIVLEIDTYGGLVTSAIDVSKFIKGKITVPTIAWVNNKAYSAGSLISAACDQIIMAPASTIGDCAPIVPGQSLAEAERAKALSPILSEFWDSMQDNGHPYALFSAFCVLGTPVYMIEHRDTNERRLVNEADKRIMVDGDSRADLSKIIAKELGGFEANAVGAPQIQFATDDHRGKWKLIAEVHNGSTLLTLTQRDAYDLGLAAANNIGTDAQLKAYLQAASVVRVDQTWSEDIAGFMTMDIVRLVLVVVCMVGMVIEMMIPGFGVFGLLSLLALLGLIIPPFIIGLAEIWHLLLFFAGVVLLMVEVFITPGFGVMGISGIICLIAGLVLSVVPTGDNKLPAPEMVGRLQQSLIWMFFALVAGSVAVGVIMRHYGRIPLFSRMVLRDEQTAIVGLQPDPDAPAVSAPPEEPMVAEARKSIAGNDALGGGTLATGAVGRSVTELRPSGEAEFDGRLIDVQTAGNWIARGRPVRVARVEGNRIFVEQV